MADPIEIRLVGKDESDKALASAESGIKSLGETADKATPKLRGLGDNADKTHRIIGTGGRQFGDYGKGLGGIGDRADEVDTRMMGLSDGIQGVTDLMGGNGKLRPHEMAMAFSDLGSFTYNSLIPTLQDAGEKTSNLLDKMGGIKGALIGGGAIAAVAGLGFAIKEMNDAANERNLDRLADRLQAAAFAATDMNKTMVYAAAVTGHLDDQFERALSAGEAQAEQFIELAAASGVSNDKLEEMRERLELSTGAEKAATQASEDQANALETEADKIRGVNDARRAQLDPIFGMIDALRGNQEAQRALDDAEQAASEARKEYGQSSDEYADAVRGIEDAQINAASSAANLESAATDLEAQISEHPATLSNARLALQRWVSQGLISQETAQIMALRFENAANKADEIQGTRTTDLRARDNASSRIISVGNRLRDLDGQTATIRIGAAVGAAVGNILNQAYYLATHAAGGPIGHAAAGGPRGSPVWMHEQGPEIAVHPDGSMVIPAGKSRTIMDAAAGLGGMSGPIVNIYAQGSILTERDVVGMVVQALRDKGLVPA